MSVILGVPLFTTVRSLVSHLSAIHTNHTHTHLLKLVTSYLKERKILSTHTHNKNTQDWDETAWRGSVVTQIEVLVGLCVCVCVCYMPWYVCWSHGEAHRVNGGGWKRVCLYTLTHSVSILSKPHQKKWPHTQNQPKPHQTQSTTHTHTHTWKQPLYLSVHPTHRIQPDGGRHRLLALVPVRQHQRPAVNARDCIKCNCVCLLLFSRPDRGGDQLGHKQGAGSSAFVLIQTHTHSVQQAGQPTHWKLHSL